MDFSVCKYSVSAFTLPVLSNFTERWNQIINLLLSWCFWKCVYKIVSFWFLFNIFTFVFFYFFVLLIWEPYCSGLILNSVLWYQSWKGLWGSCKVSAIEPSLSAMFLGKYPICLLCYLSRSLTNFRNDKTWPLLSLIYLEYTLIYKLRKEVFCFVFPYGQ